MATKRKTPAPDADEDDEDATPEAPIGMGPGGTLNIVNADDPPWKPRVLPDPPKEEKGK